MFCYRLAVLLSSFILFGGTVRADSIVFVTSALYNGNLGGLAGADAKCQALAQSAGLEGTYRAFVSGAAIPVRDRMVNSPGPYRLVNGTLVANNFTDLTDGTLIAAINRTETNVDISGTAELRVWTATNADFSQTDNCRTVSSPADWSTTSARTMTGVLTQTGIEWIVGGSLWPCQAQLHLYCVQQDNKAKISGRVVTTTGRGITGARITISRTNTEPFIHFTRRTGQYTSVNLAQETYTVTVSHARFNFQPSSVTVALNGADVTNTNFTGTPK